MRSHGTCGGCSSGVERLTVAQEVAGSKPVTHPTFTNNHVGIRVASPTAEVHMAAVGLLVALQNAELVLGLLVAIVLMIALWIPYLYKEIRRGKAELGPRTPVGAGDTHPGRRGDPAPGQPDAQADPYDDRARR